MTGHSIEYPGRTPRVERRVGPRLWSRLGARMSIAVLGIAMMLALVACSDDAETPTATPSETTTPAATTATPAATAEAPGPISLVDSSDFTFELAGPAQRVISHSPAATEILFALGAGGQVVARDNFSNYPPEASDLPEVAYSSPDPEQDLAHEPDLVIFSGRQRESIEQFRGLEIPVFYLLEPTDLAGVMQNIRTIATLTGHEEAGEVLIADLEARIAAIEDTLADVSDGPRVFYELSDVLHSVSPETFVGSALALLKIENIAAGADGPFPQLSSEAVVEADPEVVLVAYPVPMETILGRPGWGGVTAVADARVYPVDPDLMSRPGPRIVDGIEAVAKLLYPDHFE